jgi:hypothetical protein
MTIPPTESDRPADLRAPCPGPTFCDLAREHLALEALDVRERVASLESDVESYRALALQAIEELHYVTAEHNRLRRQLRVLFNAAREYAAARQRRAA